MERDPRVNITEITVIYFNSHAHVERDVVIVGIFFSLNNFNSHAHVERDKFFSSLLLYIKNFNSHAHVERDEMFRSYTDTIILHFNSHAHVERDVFGSKNVVRIIISTHTLTWSVTF